ncbi:diguanylate cyclase (GGDEF domain) [hydrothermal vent metagenome]|uniref:Diguanylate cyclase (GGDEF domain) n=1 Tax=hydrothermal vent metagenome TaxID=652676 RepID=A0A3B0ZFF6_9ZZZZ
MKQGIIKKPNTGVLISENPNQSVILRQKLDEIMSEARRNEIKLRRFERFELHLFSLKSLYDLIKAIVHPDKSSFHWDEVTLTLVDSDYEIRRMLEEEGVCLSDHPDFLFATDMTDFENVYPNSLFPFMGAYRPAKHTAVFPAAGRLKSVVLLPLVRYGKLIGSINIGSYDADRFTKRVRTDFFEHFAAIVAICIENATNIQRLKRQGLTDPLTGVNNRRYFDQRLNEEIGVAKRTQAPLSCLLFDIDFFKNVNDSYGHQVGDEVLREVASLIRDQLRNSDVLSRYGGEEFIALLSRTDSKTAEDIAERVRRSIQEYSFNVANHASLNLTISIGVATYYPANKSQEMSGAKLVADADQCLYQAKHAGRNIVMVAEIANSQTALAG